MELRSCFCKVATPMRVTFSPPPPSLLCTSCRSVHLTSGPSTDISPICPKILLKSKGNLRQKHGRIHRWMDWKGGGGRFGNHEQHQRQIGLMSVEGPLVKCTEQQLVRNSGGMAAKILRAWASPFCFLHADSHSRVCVRISRRADRALIREFLTQCS